MSNENGQPQSIPVFEVPTLVGVTQEFLGQIKDIASFSIDSARKAEAQEALSQLNITIPSPAAMARESVGNFAGGVVAIGLGALMRKTKFGSHIQFG